MLGYVSAVNFFFAFSSCNAYEVPIPRQAGLEEVPVGPWQTGEEAEAAFCQVSFLELKFESTHTNTIIYIIIHHKQSLTSPDTDMSESEEENWLKLPITMNR